MIERIFGFIILASIILRDFFHLIEFNHVIMISCSILGIIYLVANWWLRKPKETSARTIIVSIFYGVTSFCLMFALLFKVLYLEGSDEMSILSLILLAFTIGVDYLLGINKEKALDAWVSWRLGILSLVVGILFFIPEDYRVSITYENDPEFLEYYEEHKATMSFYDIQKEYNHFP